MGVAEAEVEVNLDVLRRHGASGGGFVVRRGSAEGEDVHAAEPERHFCGFDVLAGIAGGADDAAPVGVFAIERGFHQRRSGDRATDDFGLLFAGGACNADRDELGGAFTIAGDLFGQVDARLGERFLKFLARRLDARGAVGEDEQRVVGAGVAVDGDAVERAARSVLQAQAQARRRDNRVGHHHAEHGGHVGMDHAAALGGAGQAPAFVREFDAGRFGDHVGGHDRGGGGVEAVF